MKQILLMRHGKSDWSNPELEDFDRPLKKRGRKDSAMMGKLLNEKKQLPGVVLCSTAARAKETLARLQKSITLDADILYYDTFYYEGIEAIINALGKLPDKVNRAMVIGHNPTMENLVMRVFNLEHKEIKMPTAAIAFISNNTSSWKTLQWKESKLDAILTPKDFK